MAKPTEHQRQLEIAIQQKSPNLLKGISEDKKKELLGFFSAMQTGTQVTTQVAVQQYSGPIPQAEDLEKFNKIIPDGAHRIMLMAENQSAHRMEIEKKVIAGQIEDSKRGQWFAFLTVVVLSASGIAAALAGHDWVAGGIFTTTIIGVASVFVVAKKKQSKDLESKSKS